jgi:IMP dehydrogenase
VQFAKAVVDAELDLLVIQGTVVSAEHVSKSVEPLDLKRFIRQYDIPVVVGGCTSYPAALHLMRTGAVGVLVGVGTGSASTSKRVLGLGAPHATALADVAGARSRHLEETGVYVHVIADGGMSTGGDVTKAIACGADAVMIGAPLAAAASAPGQGRYWEMTAAHERLPRGELLDTPRRGSLEEILVGPSHEPSGALNLFGSLRAAMAMCGYASVREFHKADIVVAG